MPEMMKIRRIAARAAALLCAAVMLCLFCVPQNAYASTKHNCDPEKWAALWKGMNRTDTTRYYDGDAYVQNLSLSVRRTVTGQKLVLSFTSKTKEWPGAKLDAGFTLVVINKNRDFLGKFYDHISCYRNNTHFLTFNSSDCIEGSGDAIDLFCNDYMHGGSEYRIFIESVRIDGEGTPFDDDWDIDEQPTDQTAAAGKKATFSLTTFGTDLSYQWYIDRNDGKGWKVLNGANGTSYVTSAVTKNCDGFRYYCKVTNPKGGEMDSAEAVLHVTPAPPTGDASVPSLWLAALTVSCLAMLMLCRKAKKSDS